MKPYLGRLTASLVIAAVSAAVLAQTASATITWELTTVGWWFQRIDVTTGGTFDFKVGAEKELECKVSDTGNLEPNSSSSLRSITFSSCEQTKPAKCPAKVTAEGLPWPVRLRHMLPASKFAELTRNVVVSFTIEMPCTVVVLQKISGNVEGEWSNTGSTEAFPTSALSESSLKSEGAEVVLSGSDKDESPSGVEVAEWPGLWVVAGTSLGEEGKAALASSAQVDAAPTLRIPQAGVKISCAASSVRASTPEILGEYLGLAALVTFEGCSTTEPKTHCELASSKIATAAVAAKAEAITKTSASRVTVVPQTKKTLAEVQFKEGTACVFEGAQPLKGAVTLNAPAGQTEAAVQTIEGLGSTENNSLELGSGDKAFVEGGKVLVRLGSSSKWAFH